MSTETILIIDDEKTNRKLLKLLLIKEGYQFLMASSGEEALKIINETIPDLILLDVMMPGIDGFEVCQRLRTSETTKNIPVIMVTALRENEHKLAAMHAGADDFICKPLDRIELLVRVKSLLRIKAYHDELVQNNRTITMQNNQLRELEKAKESLTHMIIHDLNNYLMGISGTLQLMRLKVESSQTDLDGYVQNCSNYTAEIVEMVKGLLDIHRMEEGQLGLSKEMIDLDALVQDSIEPLVAVVQKKKITIDFLNSSNKVFVKVDSGIMKRVIANLLNNAVRHSPEGNKIEIGIHPDQTNENMCISIKDFGIGLAPEYHQKIFNKFEQVELKQKKVRSGAAGLGLAFCKMAVEAHHGRIWVESEGKDQGCTFYIHLPL